MLFPGTPTGPDGSSPSAGSGQRGSAARSCSSEQSSRPALLSQLRMFVSLLEDLQCRFSLAQSRMQALLAGVATQHYLASHVQHHLKRAASGKLSEEDAQLIHVSTRVSA